MATRAARTYARADAQVRARVKRFVTATWDGLGSYRNDDVERFVRAVVPVVLGGQRQVAALTDAYLASVSAQTFGTPARVAGVRASSISGEALRGVSPAEVYRRPGVSVWTALSRGKSLADAVAAGRERLLDISSTDLQLAKTHTARAVFAKDSRITGYQRVLSGAEDCGLCVLASTQRYHIEDLMPIHPGCDCDVEPIYGNSDPGQVIDEDTLAEAHGAIAERFGAFDVQGRGTDAVPAYKDIIIVREHGELGPLLTVKGQHFAGPSDV